MLSLVLGFIGGCARVGPVQPRRATQTKVLMGTYVTVDVCYERAEAVALSNAYHDVWARLEEVAGGMSIYDPQSEISKLNHSYPDAVSVGHDLYYILESSIRLSELTQGAFDITVSPLVHLWRDAAKEERVPSKAQIALAKDSVGVPSFELLEDQRARLLKPGTSLDLGGIAKGYAVDEAARVLRSKGFKDFFIDAGGDLYVGGQSCKGTPWRIGIRNPARKDQIIDIVEVRNQAVTTSGHYEQYFEIDGQSYSHIIDPRTGVPQKGVVSATVIAPIASEADALATALCVLTEKEGLELIEALGESYAALLIVPDPRLDNLKLMASLKYQAYRLPKVREF
ncbi:MAG TPA: FAD:protein FMN transferase [Candidatus Omnitrophota bacterium]|nr:FAD:protein FMN transferase [Candidatus Omnitrophota bacterium]